MTPVSPDKIKITDIARAANVSPGTVDRVLHGRGEVAEKTKKKVLSVIEKLGYKPNLLARSLATKKSFRFVSLLPEHRPGEYWESPEKGIDKAREEIRLYNVSVEKMYFDQFDAQSFVAASESLIAFKPDAALIAPMFRNDAVLLTERLLRNRIPCVYIDSNAEDEHYLSYFGQHSYQSGYVAARLTETGLPPGSEILMVRTIRISGTSNQIERREDGFSAYFRDKGLTDKYRLIRTKLSVDNDSDNRKELTAVFEKHRNIRAAVVFNSRAYQLADILNKLKIKNIKLIGYDLSGDNIARLKDGSISFLIAQRPEEQGYRGIMALCDRVVFNGEINRINYMPIDIIAKENVDYYETTPRANA